MFNIFYKDFDGSLEWLYPKKLIEQFFDMKELKRFYDTKENPIIAKNGQQLWLKEIENGDFIMHRDNNLPCAIEKHVYPNIDIVNIIEMYRVDGKLHRTDGPAFFETENNKILWKFFYLDNIKYKTQKQWKNAISKMV